MQHLLVYVYSMSIVACAPLLVGYFLLADAFLRGQISKYKINLYYLYFPELSLGFYPPPKVDPHIAVATQQLQVHQIRE